MRKRMKVNLVRHAGDHLAPAIGQGWQGTGTIEIRGKGSSTTYDAPWSKTNGDAEKLFLNLKVGIQVRSAEVF
jgi:hypothetical protein